MTAILKPDHAFILAAGKGTRLRPYTDLIPKPLVIVKGQTLIDRILDQLEAAGVTHATVNLHYKADILKTHLAKRKAPHLTFSYEPELLDTGGGIKKALPSLGDKPFYVIAGDAFWIEGHSGNALSNLAAQWNDQTMDLITYMQPLSSMVLTHGVGDYSFDQSGQAIRSLDQTGTHMWTNIRLNHPRIFEGAPEGAFSFLTLMDQAQAKGRLRALEYDGQWHHISTPADLERVNAVSMAEKRTG